MCQQMKELMYSVYEENSNKMEGKLQELFEVLERCTKLNIELVEANQALSGLREALAISQTPEPWEISYYSDVHFIFELVQVLFRFTYLFWMFSFVNILSIQNKVQVKNLVSMKKLKLNPGYIYGQFQYLLIKYN